MKYYLTLIAVFVGLAVVPMQADASIEVTADDISVPAGVSTFVDVFANVTGAPVDISGWQFRVDMDPAAAGFITITGIGSSAAPHPNVFAGQSPFLLSGSSDSVDVTNFLFTPGDSDPLDDQDGFFRIFLDVALNTPQGTYDVIIDPSTAEVSDNTFPTPIPLPFSIDDGTITVDGVIPEPASVIIWGLIAGVVGIYGLKWSKNRKPPSSE